MAKKGLYQKENRAQLDPASAHAPRHALDGHHARDTYHEATSNLRSSPDGSIGGSMSGEAASLGLIAKDLVPSGSRELMLSTRCCMC